MVVALEALIIGVLTDVGLIVVEVIVIALNAVADAIVGIMPKIGVEVLVDVNKLGVAVVMTALDFPVSTPLEECSP